MVYADPLTSIINKIKASSRIIALTPPSRIHSGFMPDIPDINRGIYVTVLNGALNQIVSSGNQTNQTLQGRMHFQIDALSTESTEDADLLAKTACQVCLPSIVAAGIFNMNLEPRGAAHDNGYKCYRSTWRILCPCVEFVTG
jgi:hypothetical protein